MQELFQELPLTPRLDTGSQIWSPVVATGAHLVGLNANREGLIGWGTELTVEVTALNKNNTGEWGEHE